MITGVHFAEVSYCLCGANFEVRLVLRVGPGNCPENSICRDRGVSPASRQVRCWPLSQREKSWEPLGAATLRNGSTADSFRYFFCFEPPATARESKNRPPRQNPRPALRGGVAGREAAKRPPAFIPLHRNRPVGSVGALGKTPGRNSGHRGRTPPRRSGRRSGVAQHSRRHIAGGSVESRCFLPCSEKPVSLCIHCIDRLPYAGHLFPRRLTARGPV